MPAGLPSPRPCPSHYATATPSPAATPPRCRPTCCCRPSRPVVLAARAIVPAPPRRRPPLSRTTRSAPRALPTPRAHFPARVFTAAGRALSLGSSSRFNLAPPFSSPRGPWRGHSRPLPSFRPGRLAGLRPSGPPGSALPLLAACFSFPFRVFRRTSRARSRFRTQPRRARVKPVRA